MAGIATAMPPNPPAPSLGSPRTNAAMRVLGVRKPDITPFEKTQFPGELKFEYSERKRRQIIDQVHTLASSSPQGGGHIGSGDQTSAFLDEIARIERENLMTMRKMAKRAGQDEVLIELAGKVQDAKSREKQAESRARLKELQKERDAKLAAMKKEAAKRAERNNDARKRAETKREEEADKVLKHMDEVAERVERTLKAEETKRLDRVEVQKAAAAQKQDHVKNLVVQDWADRDAKYAEIREKDEATKVHLARIADSDKAARDELAAKLASAVDKAARLQVEKQKKKDDNYMAILARHEESAAKKKEFEAKRDKEMITRHNKERQNHENRYDRILKEIEEKEEESLQNLIEGKHFGRSKSSSMPIAGQKSPALQRTLELHDSMEHLTQWNITRLRRAHSYSQMEALKKIEGIRQKVDTIHQSRRTAAQRRMLMVKNCAVERSQLQLQLERIRDSGPKKMSKLLGELEPEPEAATKINEMLKSLNMELLPGTKLETEEDSK